MLTAAVASLCVCIAYGVQRLCDLVVESIVCYVVHRLSTDPFANVSILGTYRLQMFYARGRFDRIAQKTPSRIQNVKYSIFIVYDLT